MTCAEKFFVTVDISLLLLQLLPFHYLFGKILIDKSPGRMKSRPAFVGLLDRVTRESFHELSAGLVLVLCLETCRQLLTTQPRGVSRNFISLKMTSVALFADLHTEGCHLVFFGQVLRELGHILLVNKLLHRLFTELV